MTITYRRSCRAGTGKTFFKTISVIAAEERVRAVDPIVLSDDTGGLRDAKLKTAKKTFPVRRA